MNHPDDADKTIVSRGSGQEPRTCPVCGMRVAGNLANCPNDGTVLVRTLEMGAAISDKYEIIGELGRGGLGIVYLANQRLLNKRFAIKMLHADTMSPQQIARFHTEARALSKLKHPNLVQVVDFGMAEGNQPYMVMEFIEGKTLSQLIAKENGLDPKLAVDIVIQIARAMAYAHSQSVVHRDLKPGNIIISNAASHRSPPVVHVLDFGLAKISGEDSGEITLTRTGEIFGSPLYMSPEQGQGKKVDERSDVYSLGCILYELIRGAPPFIGASTMELLVNRASSPAPALSKTAKGKHVPLPLAGIVSVALERDLRKRFQSMQAFEQALLRWRKTGIGIVRFDNSLWLYGAVAGIVMMLCAAFTMSLFSPSHDALPSKPIEAKLVSPSKDGLLEGATETFSNVDPVAEKIRNEESETIAIRGQYISVEDLKLLRSKFNLKKLVFMGYQNPPDIDDEKLDYIVDLPLTELTLIGCPHLTDLGAKKLAKMRTLNSLTIEGAPIGNKGVEYLRPLGLRLGVLNLNDTRVTDAGAEDIARNFPALTDLSLRGDRVSGKVLRDLQRLKQLDVLDISFTGVRQPDLTVLSVLPPVRNLKIGGLFLTGDVVNYLRLAPHVLSLEISFNERLGDSGLQKLAGLANLKELRAFDCGYTRAGKQSFCQMRPDVTFIDVNPGESATSEFRQTMPSDD